MSFRPGHLQAHPLPPGIVGALGLNGYQLLADVAGVGAGRLGPQVFLLVAPDPDPALPDAVAKVMASGSADFRARVLVLLGRSEDPRIADVLLASYPRLEPELQPLAIDLLLVR